MKRTYLILIALFAMVVPSMNIDAGKCKKVFIVKKCSKSKGTCRRARVCIIDTAPRSVAAATTSSQAQPSKEKCDITPLKDKAGNIIKVVRLGCGNVAKPVMVGVSKAMPTPEKTSAAMNTAGTMSQAGTKSTSSTGLMSAASMTLPRFPKDEVVESSEELDESSDEGEYDEVSEEVTDDE